MTPPQRNMELKSGMPKIGLLKIAVLELNGEFRRCKSVSNSSGYTPTGAC